MTTILAIDDEPQNLRLLQLYLSDTDYTVLTAENGSEGWKLLVTYGDRVSVILLDRMMPVMNGMEFLARLKKDADFAHIPVIMQTAAAETHLVVEGIQAGVFYYLSKPYSEELLLAIIQAALQDHIAHDALLAEVKKYKRLAGLITQCQFSLRTLDEARDLAAFLANCFPDPSRMALGLSEILINAVEHGNLSISYEEKSELQKRGAWESEIQRRLALPEYANKQVQVQYTTSATEIAVTVCDEGKGFDWRPYLEVDPARATDTHGRGIALARMISFDEVRYAGTGNQVTCIVRRQ